MKIGGLEVAIYLSQSWQQIMIDRSFLHQNITCFVLSSSTCWEKLSIQRNTKVSGHRIMYTLTGGFLTYVVYICLVTYIIIPFSGLWCEYHQTMLITTIVIWFAYKR